MPKKTTKKRKKTKKTRKKKKQQISFSPLLFILILIAGLSALGAYFIFTRLSLTKTPTPKQIKSINASHTKIKKKHLKIQSNKNKKHSYQQYEEEQRKENEFNIKINKVDLLLIQNLYQTNQKKVRIISHKSKLRYIHNNPYKFQEIILYVPNAQKFINNFKKDLQLVAPFASIKKMNSSIYYLLINGILTHRIVLKTKKIIPTKKAKMALIIDDIGRSIKKATQLLNLDLNITLSLLPYAPYTSKISHLAMLKKQDVMLHLPMEPEGYPISANPGPGALFVNMSPQDLQITFLQDLNLVPNAVGVNNHMGSKFTAFNQGMKIIFKEIKKRNLFFLDSLTTPKSVSRKLARELNIAYLRRDIFLDNVQDEKAILFQLHKAEAIALKKGFVIAIGHPYPVTISTLSAWKNTKNSHIQLIKVKKLTSIHTF
ncbi:divergent polysaccharide deacetylase family protein [Desulfonauticus submarinus]